MARAPRRPTGGRTEAEVLRARPYEDVPPVAETPNMFGRKQPVGARGLMYRQDEDEPFRPDMTDPSLNFRNRRQPEQRLKKGGKVMAAKKKYQKGGNVHSDEAMDKVLIRKEIAKAKGGGARFAKGGGVEIQGKTKGKLT